MKCIKHTADVYELQNIFTDEEYIFIKAVFDNLLEENWKGDAVDLRLQTIEDLIKYLFPLFTSHELIAMSPKFYRQVAKSIDEIKNDSRDNDDEGFFYSAYWFINDDYDGGEFVYADGTKVKPKARSLLIHPADEEYLLRRIIGSNPKHYLFGYVRGNKNGIYGKLHQEKLDKMSLNLL